MTINELDQARSEAFAERMLGVLNDGALALMTTVSTMQALWRREARVWARCGARRRPRRWLRRPASDRWRSNICPTTSKTATTSS